MFDAWTGRWIRAAAARDRHPGRPGELRRSVYLPLYRADPGPVASWREEAHSVDRVARGREDREGKEEARPGEAADEFPELHVGGRGRVSELVEQRRCVDVCEQVVPFEDDPDRLCGWERHDDEAHGRLHERAEGELERLATRQEGKCGPGRGS